MRVLLVNDDGPPAPHSPHILGIYETLKVQLGWDVSVVLPSSQKSWGSMAFTLHPPCSVWYYYPIKGNYDGMHERTAESWSPTKRPVKDDELGEWILVDGSPTTCANIGLFSLHTLQPVPGAAEASLEKGKPAFDLVISGPNFGRNSGTAFSLCSGTIGAALAASLSGVRSIAISYAHFHQANKMVREAEAKREEAQKHLTSASSPLGQLPASAPLDVVQRAHQLSCTLAKKLADEWEPEVGAYSINVPLSYNLMDRDAGDKVYWTRTWDSKFGPLFALEEEGGKESPFKSHGMGDDEETSYKPKAAPAPKLALKFAPDMAAMLQPANTDERRTETDIWAIMHGYISVARLSPSYTTVSPATTQQPSSTSAGNTPGCHFKL
jgi:5'/3'-nucleotidase SurE